MKSRFCAICKICSFIAQIIRGMNCGVYLVAEVIGDMVKSRFYAENGRKSGSSNRDNDREARSG